MARIIWESKNEIESDKIRAEIEGLKRRLAETDYIIVKSSECQLLGIEIPYDIDAIHKERQAIRDKINSLKSLI